MAKPASKINMTQSLGFGIGSLATGIASTIPGLFLMYYLTQVLGVSASLAGFAFFIPRVVDVITDTIMGRISDQAQTPWGRRRPFMLFGAITSPITFALVFYDWHFTSQWASFSYVLVMYIFATTFFTIFAVPYLSMPAEVTDSREERTYILAYRMGFLVLGILITGTVGEGLTKLGKNGFLYMGIAMGAIMGLGMLLCVIGTRGMRSLEPESKSEPLLESIRNTIKKRSYNGLITVFAIQAVAMGGLLSMVKYYADFVMNNDDLTTLLFAGLVVPSLISMPLWVWVANRIGKYGAYRMSILIFIMGASALALLDAGQNMRAVIAACILGVGYAGLQLFPFSILPDIIADDRDASHISREGVMTGLWSATEKVSIAFGGLIAGFTIDAFGFVEGASSQSGLTAQGIILAFVLIPIVLCGVSMVLLRKP